MVTVGNRHAGLQLSIGSFTEIYGTATFLAA